MLIKPRRVRRSSKFTPRLKTVTRQRREYAATSYSMAVLLAVLAVVMVVAGVRAFQAFDAHAAAQSFAVKAALPVVFFAGALLAARTSVRNIRQAREIGRGASRAHSDDAE